MSPSTNNHADRGFIIPIGGAEEKFHNREILDRFIDICGGKDARVGIIPTASELEDTGRNYEKLFRKILTPLIENKGKRFLFRSAASLLTALAQLPPQPVKPVPQPASSTAFPSRGTRSLI